MKRLLPFVPLLLLAALLLFPAAALHGARQGLDIWWGRVFPALLPSFICVKLAQRLGLLRAASRHPRGQLIVVIGFSLLSGAPNGAKLMEAMAEDGSISREEAHRLLPLVNSVSPAFLLSIIASDPSKNKALLLPMAASFYGCILCLIMPQTVRIMKQSTYKMPSNEVQDLSFFRALSAAVGDSMQDMLRIGGCIVLICTLLSVIRPIVPSDPVYVALAGLLEVSTGTSVLGELSIPLRLKASLLMGVSAFGGLSLTLQTMCCCPELHPGPYLLKKLLLGAMVGLCCYLLIPLFPNVSTVFASRQEVLIRGLGLGALILSSSLSAAFIFVLSLMISQRKRS